MRKLLFLLLVVVLMLLLVSPTFAARIPKDTLVIAANTGILISLDPAVVYEVLGAVIVNGIYDKLVDYGVENGTLVPKPELAEKWELSPDGKVFTFYLRKGVKFASGNPVTADDVVFSFKRHALLESPSVWLLNELGIDKTNVEEKVKKIDDYTVQIANDKGLAPNIFLGILTNSFGSVVDMKVALQHEKDGDFGKDWLTDHSAGAGPYVLETWERNSRVVMRANPNYWGEKPKLKTIIFLDVPESTNQRLLVEKGDADVAWNLEAQHFIEIQQNPNVKAIMLPGQANEYLAMNCSWGPLKDPKVRLAIKYAIDYDGIINDIMQGLAIKVQGFIPKGYFGYVPENPFNQDIEKAKQLLAEAGYPDGFEVELLTSDSDTRKNEAVKVQADLAKVGIKANIVIMKASQMYSKYRQQGHQIIIAGWGIDYADPDALAKPFADYRAHQLAWRNVWYDDYAADLAEKAAFELDPVKRAEIYKELTYYWFENGPFAMFYQTVSYWAIRKEVQGWEDAFFGYSMRVDWTKVYKE